MVFNRLSMKPRCFFLIVAFSYFLISCSTSKKAADKRTTLSSLPSLPASQINIPVRIYLKPLLAKMDSTTAKEFTSEQWPNFFQPTCDFRYKYRFIRSGFSFSCVNNKVNIAFQGSYQIAGSKTVCAFDKQVSPWVSGSCGFGSEPMRKVDISIGSILELLPQYQVRTTTKIEKLQPREKCVVSLLQTDMTRQVMDSIQSSIESYTSSFDKFVQSINSNQILHDWRTNGNRVFAVSNYGFMNLRPSSLSIGRFNYHRDTLAFSVGFQGSPRFSSDSATIITTKYLPTFNTSESAPGIATFLDAFYEYGFLSQLLNDSLRNKPFQVEGRSFFITNIKVSGSEDNKLLVDVSFDGNRRGTLHLNGTPLLDTARQLLTMPDISFSLDSRDMLVNIAKGLFRKKILKKLVDQSVFDIGELIRNNKKIIEARFNQQLNGWLHTKGEFHELKLVGLLPIRNGIQIQVFLKGNISVIGSPTAEDFVIK